MRASHLHYYCTWTLESAPPARIVSVVLPWAAACCSTDPSLSLRAVDNFGCGPRLLVGIPRGSVNTLSRILRWRKLPVFLIVHHNYGRAR